MLGGGTPRGAYAGCAAKSLLLAGTKVWVDGWVGGWVGVFVFVCDVGINVYTSVIYVCV